MADVLLRENCGEGVVLLRLHRPQVRNALNLQLRHALADAVRGLAAEQGVRCIVLTGDEKAFCAGADLREYVDADPIEIAERRMGPLWDAVADCPHPVIAAVQGHALGGGCELAMHADIIVAGEGARFGQPEIRVGLIPGGGATQRLVRAVGKHAAMKMLLTGKSIAAGDAKAIGLVSELVPDNQVLPVALEMARDLAAQSAFALRQIKELAIESMKTPLASGLALERKAFQLVFASPEKTTRIRAFLDRA